VTSISSQNHWWQNWSKTHAYVAERMFFPRYPDDIADAIRQAEAQQRPLRAVGGGFSFSDASLPGSVATIRPGVPVVEAQAAVLPSTTTFPAPTQPSIASIPAGMRGADGAGSMVMTADPGSLETNIGLWSYSGAGTWKYGEQWTYPPDAQTLDYFVRKGVRPVRNPGTALVEDSDVAGSLVMFDMTKSPPVPSADWFYRGKGVWSVGVAGDSPFDQGDLDQLRYNGRLGGGAILSPRAAGPGEALSLLLSQQDGKLRAPEPVFLIDTRSLTSSLQQDLPNILSQPVMDSIGPVRPRHQARRFLFHVEAGIPTAELGELLAHQSPKLSLRASSGSSGATLAGALSSATHGAEFTWPLLIDTVKAVHLIGPGGLHWWIEGEEVIADPQKLRQAYPELAPERIITGTTPIAGISPQDWLKAVVVSMGSVGVLYSVVLEVVPQFGVHEAVIQTTWRNIGILLATAPMPNPALQGLGFDTKLRLPQTTKAASSALLEFILDGSKNGTMIGPSDNRYADLAINPNRSADGDFDCWIGNREETAYLPIDPQPASANETAAMLRGINRKLKPDIVQKLQNINRLGSPWDILQNASPTVTKLGRVGDAADPIDVALDMLLTPMIGQPDGPDVAQALLSGILAGMLGTANADFRSDKTGVNVGATGFPGSGIMGTGLEIALAPADAFGFLMREILDKVDAFRPFLGYVSIRVCSMTNTLMGMQQYGDTKDPYSVMIEVVAFATPNSLAFIRDLQIRTVNLINGGLDAMLHWGLENDRLNGGHLRNTMALRRPASPGISKLDTFKAVRALLQAASPSAFHAFDNWFTSRLWLASQIADDDPYSFQTVVQGTRKPSVIPLWNRGHAPMRIVGVSADGDFRMRDSLDTPSRPANLEAGPFPASPTPVGGVFQLPVTFIAREPGQHTGVLTVLTYADAPDSIRVIRVHLYANVEAIVVSVVEPPAALDFGTVTVGDTKGMPIVVHSDSTMPVGLGSYDSSDASAASQLAVATTGVGPVLPGQNQSYWASFTPNRIGPFSTDLILTFRGGGVTTPAATQQLTIHVAGSAIGAQAELSPPMLDFGTVTVGARGAPLPVTLRNTGQLPLTVHWVLIGAGFQLTGQPPTNVGPGQQEEIDIEFRPQGDGLMSYAFSIASNSAQPPAPVALTGVGVLQAYLTANPAVLAYDPVPVGSMSPEKAVVITNAGVLPVELHGFSLTGPDAADFGITSNDHAIGDVLRPEQRCRMTLTLTPTAPGPKAATLEIAHDGATSPLRIPVEGLATAPLGLVPSVTEIDFGDVPVATTSKRRRLTLTNAAAAAADVTEVAVTGRDLTDFRVVSEDCTRNPLQPGAKCAVTVSAGPGEMGDRDAELTVTADVPADPVALHATGLDVRVEWSAPLLDFGTWQVGQTSQRQEASIHNTGNATIDVTQIDVAGAFMVRDVVPQYMSIPPDGYKYFWVWFKPTATGIQQGSITLQTSGRGTLPNLPLTGIGA
jgi:hypothetical protein